MSDNNKRLLELLKSGHGKTAIRSLFKTLAKGDQAKQTFSSNADELGADQTNFEDKVPVSEEAGESESRDKHLFITDTVPHHEHQDKPWMVYKIGEGHSPGEPINFGNPVTSDDIIKLIHSDKHNPHHLFVRPSFKNQGWQKLKDSHFSKPLNDHIARQHEVLMNNPTFENKQTPVSLIERYADHDISKLNQKELNLLLSKR